MQKETPGANISQQQPPPHPPQSHKFVNKPHPVKSIRGSLLGINNLLDSAYSRLRPLETIFIVGVVLCCTTLCLYVTHKHLELQSRVIHLETQVLDTEQLYLQKSWQSDRKNIEVTQHDRHDLELTLKEELQVLKQVRSTVQVIIHYWLIRIFRH